MKRTKTLAFNIDLAVAALITRDAEAQHSNESTILRQIVFKHYAHELKKSPDPVSSQHQSVGA
jgi:hypothetical protein